MRSRLQSRSRDTSWAGSVLLRDIADGSAPHSFKLTRSRVSPNGVIVGHYEREGEIKIDDTLRSPSKREIARRERMKREG
jgi:hypothetical protein